MCAKRGECQTSCCLARQPIALTTAVLERAAGVNVTAAQQESANVALEVFLDAAVRAQGHLPPGGQQSVTVDVPFPESAHELDQCFTGRRWYKVVESAAPHTRNLCLAGFFHGMPCIPSLHTTETRVCKRGK